MAHGMYYRSYRIKTTTLPVSPMERMDGCMDGRMDGWMDYLLSA